jgi:hypothetical protein
MHMKKIWCLLLLVFLATGICAAEIPNLVGNWTGSQNGYVNENGVAKLFENGSIGLVITEQNDRLFTGNLTYTLNGAEIVEGLAGAIGLDNKTLYIAEFDQGYDMGTIISDDEIELIYLADGENGQTFIDSFTAFKA